MPHYTIAPLSSDESAALNNAVLMGAFSERQATLRALIEHNRGRQLGDFYERELAALERAASAITNPKFHP